MFYGATRAAASLVRGATRLNSSPGSALQTVAKTSYSAIKSPYTRPIVGAIAGGLYGGIATDQETSTGRIESALTGAFAGAGLAGASIFAPSVAKTILSKTAKNLPSRAWGKEKLNLAWQAGKTLFYNPKRTIRAAAGIAGIAGLGYGATELAGSRLQSLSSPTLAGDNVDINYNQQAIAAQELQMAMISNPSSIGSAPQMMGRAHAAMQQSTYGLTNGLHRGRHG